MPTPIYLPQKHDSTQAMMQMIMQYAIMSNRNKEREKNREFEAGQANENREFRQKQIDSDRDFQVKKMAAAKTIVPAGKKPESVDKAKSQVDGGNFILGDTMYEPNPNTGKNYTAVKGDKYYWLIDGAGKTEKTNIPIKAKPQALGAAIQGYGLYKAEGGTKNFEGWTLQNKKAGAATTNIYAGENQAMKVASHESKMVQAGVNLAQKTGSLAEKIELNKDNPAVRPRVVEFQKVADENYTYVVAPDPKFFDKKNTAIKKVQFKTTQDGQQVTGADVRKTMKTNKWSYEKTITWMQSVGLAGAYE